MDERYKITYENSKPMEINSVRYSAIFGGIKWMMERYELEPNKLSVETLIKFLEDECNEYHSHIADKFELQK